jgi:hypothetical protein
MFKFLLILGLIVYSIYKIGTMFFRAGAASQQFKNQQPPKNFNGKNPNPAPKKSEFKGGEYIDYEDVK